MQHQATKKILDSEQLLGSFQRSLLSAFPVLDTFAHFSGFSSFSFGRSNLSSLGQYHKTFCLCLITLQK